MTTHAFIFIPGQGLRAHDLDISAFPSHADALSVEVLTLVQNR